MFARLNLSVLSENVAKKRNEPAGIHTAHVALLIWRSALKRRHACLS